MGNSDARGGNALRAFTLVLHLVLASTAMAQGTEVAVPVEMPTLVESMPYYQIASLDEAHFQDGFSPVQLVSPPYFPADPTLMANTATFGRVHYHSLSYCCEIVPDVAITRDSPWCPLTPSFRVEPKADDTSGQADNDSTDGDGGEEPRKPLVPVDPPQSAGTLR